MAIANRSTKINRTLKVLKKHYKPVPAVKDRTLFEHLLFATLLENSPYEAAEQVFKTLKEQYFDWNEVRVSTIRELGEVTKPLVDAVEAAGRLKQVLQSVFESVYQFDLETLKKQNIGAAVKHLQKLNGSTPFSVAYVTQMALGGHSIPINRGLIVAMETVGVVSDGEAKAGTVPGLERVISKSKGVEFGSMFHQFGVEVGRNPFGQTARKLMLEIDPNCKDRLPKRKTQVATPPPAPPAKEKPAPVAAKDTKRKKDDKPVAATPAAKKEAKPEKKLPPPRPPAKQPTKHPSGTKRPTKPSQKTATKKKSTSHKITKKKPR